jgi:hypothetical protein
MVTVTHEQTAEAQLNTANRALDMLARVDATGESIQFSLKQSSQELICSGMAEQEDEVEMRMKACDFRRLTDMFAKVSEFRKAIMSFDSLEGVNASFNNLPK